jgi:hypothetical protein
MRGCLLVALVLITAPASAQSLKLPTIVYAVAGGTDAASTAYCLNAHPHCHESMPHLRWLEPRGGAAAVTAGSLAFDVASIWAWNRYVGRKHPKIAAIGLYAWSAVRLSLAVHNVRQPSLHPLTFE